jgi:uncharacterized OB-fold protein
MPPVETNSPPKPVPVPDEGSRPFWEAAASHVLAIQCCDNCGWYSYPPVMLCPNCLSFERAFHFQPVSGRGTVKTWTVMRDAFLPGFKPDVPYVVVDVQLDEQAGLKVIGRLVDGADAALSLGAPVEVVFDDVAAGVSVPEFRLVARS